MNWNEFAKEVHQVAVDHGWWEEKPSFAEIAVMCHSELSEAVEKLRNGKPAVYCDAAGTSTAGPVCNCNGMECLSQHPGRKPEGYAVELADCVLRILDYLAAENFDIDSEMGYTPAAENLIETIAECHHNISKAYIQTAALDGSWDRLFHNLLYCVENIMAWAGANNVDMEVILRAKHEYNKTRPYRHGGKLL